MRRRLLPVVLAVAALLLAACGSSGSGSSGPTGPRDRGVVPGTLAAPSGVRSQPLIPSGAASSTPSSTATATTTGDFTDVTYSVPSGYSKVPDGIYSPAVPLESTYKAYYFTPDTDPLGKTLISLFVYSLPAARTVTKSTDQLDRVKAYNRQVEATIHGTIHDTSVAGRPGYQESVSQPPDYRYVAYFVFGTAHFLEFTCQFTSSTDTNAFAASCASMQLSLQTTD